METGCRRRALQFQHTAARRRLDTISFLDFAHFEFQHTAARRRLEKVININNENKSFNTQPPEGGWPSNTTRTNPRGRFQHTAARRRLAR